MPTLVELFPDSEAIRAAPIAALAGSVLRELNQQLTRLDQAECWHNFRERYRRTYHGESAALLPLAEAWALLQREGLLCPHPSNDEPWITLSRLGRQAALAHDLPRWIERRRLPDEFVHDTLRAPCLQLFRQGLFDTSVFEAFKTLEVAIRDSAGLGTELLGTRLVGRAFNTEDGPLTDFSAEAGERSALLNLVSGAIGSYKNPQSHRHVGVDAVEAREMIIIASHLLRIVESRAAMRNA